MNDCILLVVDNLVLDIYIKLIFGGDHKKDVEDDDDENEYEDMNNILRATTPYSHGVRCTVSMVYNTISHHTTGQLLNINTLAFLTLPWTLRF